MLEFVTTSCRCFIKLPPFFFFFYSPQRISIIMDPSPCSTLSRFHYILFKSNNFLMSVYIILHSKSERNKSVPERRVFSLVLFAFYRISSEHNGILIQIFILIVSLGYTHCVDSWRIHVVINWPEACLVQKMQYKSCPTFPTHCLQYIYIYIITVFEYESTFTLTLSRKVHISFWKFDE